MSTYFHFRCRSAAMMSNDVCQIIYLSRSRKVPRGRGFGSSTDIETSNKMWSALILVLSSQVIQFSSRYLIHLRSNSTFLLSHQKYSFQVLRLGSCSCLTYALCTMDSALWQAMGAVAFNPSQQQWVRHSSSFKATTEVTSCPILLLAETNASSSTLHTSYERTLKHAWLSLTSE